MAVSSSSCFLASHDFRERWHALTDEAGLPLMDVLQYMMSVIIFCLWRLPAEEADVVIRIMSFAEPGKDVSFSCWAFTVVQRIHQMLLRIPEL